MLEIFRGRKAALYIFFDLIPTFLMGIIIFLLIILMFQVLRLTEFALVHGVSISTLAEIIGYVCISMLPALLPMSLLFAVILTYGRLSTDSEIVAMKASGIHMAMILAPAVALSMLIGLVSAQTTFNIAPWGNRQFEVLFSRLGNTKAAATLRPGTFSEGFFEMVVYANEVDSDHGLLKDIFIYDASKGDSPLTIIAKNGQIVPDDKNPGHHILLRLTNGSIHRQAEGHTKINFDNFDVQLVQPIADYVREKSPQSFTLNEIRSLLNDANLSQEDRLNFQTEYHKRMAIAVLCVVFAIIGVGLGTTTNRRAQRSGGMILCIGLIIVYWITYVAFESFGRNGQLPPALAVWTPNALFAIFGFFSLKKNWN